MQRLVLQWLPIVVVGNFVANKLKSEENLYPLCKKSKSETCADCFELGLSRVSRSRTASICLSAALLVLLSNMPGSLRIVASPISVGGLGATSECIQHTHAANTNTSFDASAIIAVWSEFLSEGSSLSKLLVGLVKRKPDKVEPHGIHLQFSQSCSATS
eukprot:765411-Amphidinium_carterae.1